MRSTRAAFAGQSIRFFPVVLVVAGSAAAAAQQTNLAEKLKQLNVRVQTQHYVLAGTVPDKRMHSYGQVLEAIYREYAAGFQQILEEEEEADARPDNPAGRPADPKYAPEKPAKAAPASGRDKKSAARPEAGKPESGRPEAGEPQAGKTQSDKPRAGKPKAGKSNAGQAQGGKAEPSAAADTSQTMDQEDPQRRFRVLVFGTQNEYEEFGREFLHGRTENTNGMFIPALQVLLIRDQGNVGDTSETLFHEAFHQFMHRYVANPPTWLDEGLAQYFGDARGSGGRLVFRPDSHKWKLCRKLIEKQVTVPLRDVVGASKPEFYMQTPAKLSGYDELTRKTVYYTEAYTLVHLLLSRDDGRQRVQDFLRALAKDRGRNTARVTAEFFGPEVCDRLTTPWIEHARSRPDNR